MNLKELKRFTKKYLEELEKEEITYDVTPVITTIYHSLGFKELNVALYKDVIDGKYDNYFYQLQRGGEKKNPHTNFYRNFHNPAENPLYQKYFQGKPKEEEIKNLMKRYLLMQNSDRFQNKDLKDLKKVILLLLQRAGYSKVDFQEEFIKDFLRGKARQENPILVSNSKLEDLSYAYNHKEDNMEQLKICFQNYFGKFLDVYSIEEEQMLSLIEKELEREENKNVFR